MRLWGGGSTGFWLVFRAGEKLVLPGHVQETESPRYEDTIQRVADQGGQGVSQSEKLVIPAPAYARAGSSGNLVFANCSGSLPSRGRHTLIHDLALVSLDNRSGLCNACMGLPSGPGDAGDIMVRRAARGATTMATYYHVAAASYGQPGQTRRLSTEERDDGNHTSAGNVP